MSRALSEFLQVVIAVFVVYQLVVGIFWAYEYREHLEEKAKLEFGVIQHHAISKEFIMRDCYVHGVLANSYETFVFRYIWEADTESCRNPIVSVSQ